MTKFKIYLSSGTVINTSVIYSNTAIQKRPLLTNQTSPTGFTRLHQSFQLWSSTIANESVVDVVFQIQRPNTSLAVDQLNTTPRGLWPETNLTRLRHSLHLWTRSIAQTNGTQETILILFPAMSYRDARYRWQHESWTDVLIKLISSYNKE